MLPAALGVVGALLGGPATGQAPPGAAEGTVVTDMSRACWHVFQAKNGDYWFGSDGQGVYRWDGKTLVNYTTTDGLSGNRIRGIQGDKAGNVYFTTFGGICRFDGRVFRTLPVTLDEGAGGGWRLDPDDLWFPWFTEMPTAPSTPDSAPVQGPYRFDGTTLYHLRLPKSDLETEGPRPRWSPYEVYSIYRDSRGHVWIGTGEFGVCRYDGRSFGWLYEQHLTIAPNGGSFGIRSVTEDKDGAFWICNTRFRFRVQPENEGGKVVYTREAGIAPQLTGGKEVYFQGAEADAKGDLWLSPYGGGIWRYDGAGMTHYPVKDEGRDTHVFRVFKDNAGAMWLGTPTAGPYRFDGEAFVPFRP
ncbi:MAG: hypothetical protein KDE27_25005 [Planctomycetes bacterium]|nr:hypothetical protein [Planctomycetota bacterium]